MSDPIGWTRAHPAELRCNEPLRRVAVSPDDVYLACLTRCRDTVVVLHRETAETVAVLRGLPVADLGWCALDRLAVLRESAFLYSLYVHELPDGGEVTAHIFERPTVGAPTLCIAREAHAAAVVYRDTGDEGPLASRRVEVFTGPRLEARREVTLLGMPEVGSRPLRRVRAATLHPHGDAALLHLATEFTEPDHFVLASLDDGATAVVGASYLPSPHARCEWRAPGEALLRFDDRTPTVCGRVDTAARKVTWRGLDALVFSTDLHPERDRLLVAHARPGASRLEFDVSVLSVVDEAAAPTLRWHAPLGEVRYVQAVWDRQDGAVLAVSLRGGMQVERWSGVDAPPEVICARGVDGRDPRALRLHPTATRRHIVMTEPHGDSRPGEELVHASLITV